MEELDLRGKAFRDLDLRGTFRNVYLNNSDIGTLLIGGMEVEGDLFLTGGTIESLYSKGIKVTDHVEMKNIYVENILDLSEARARKVILREGSIGSLILRGAEMEALHFEGLTLRGSLCLTGARIGEIYVSSRDMAQLVHWAMPTTPVILSKEF